MNKFLQYCGVLIILIGVAILVVYNAQTAHNSNTLLIVSLAVIFVGIILQILLNRRSWKLS